MNTIFKSGSVAALAALLLATVGAGAAPASHTFLYEDTIAAPSGNQQNVTAMITLEPQAGGATRVSITATGGSPMTVTIPANGTPPAPQGSPTPQQAQGALILRRVALLGELKKAGKSHSKSLAISIPVLPPGALAPLALPATMTPALSAGAVVFSASAATATTATINPEKAKIKGITPVRRLGERVKNAAMPKSVTLPDQISATVTATVKKGPVVTLSGHVSHALTAKGKTTTINEDWSLKPAP